MVTAARGRNDASRFGKNTEGQLTLAVRRDFIEHEFAHPSDTQGDIAESIGVDYGRLNAVVNGRSAWTAEIVVALARGGFYGPLRALCERCGGLFVLSPRVSRTAGIASINKALLKMMKEVHEALEICFRAISDGVLMESERDKCITEIDQAIASLDAARQRLMEAPVQREIGHV